MPCLALAVLFSLSLAVLFLLLLRPFPADRDPIPSVQSRRVSFSLVTSDASYAIPPPLCPPSSPPKKNPRRPLSLSLSTRRRSSSSSTLFHLDLPPATSPPPQRTRFVNPFTRHSRSRTLSPPSTLKSPASITPPFTARRTIVSKFKSIFKSTSPQPSPIIQSKPIVKSINARLRRKPVARTQPYGPPWNAPMPVPDFTLSQHPPRTISPTPTSRIRPLPQSSLPEKTSISPGQLSPHTFINQLDEKLSLLQQQRFKDLIP